MSMKTLAMLRAEKEALQTNIASLQATLASVQKEIHELQFQIKVDAIIEANGNRFKVHSFDDEHPYLQLERKRKCRGCGGNLKGFDTRWDHARPALYWKDWKKGTAKTPFRRY